MEQIRCLVMDLQVKQELRLTGKSYHPSKTNSILTDDFNLLQENHSMAIGCCYGVVKNILSYKFSNIIEMDIEYYKKKIAVSADYFLLQLHKSIPSYQNTIILWKPNNIPIAYGGTNGNNTTIGISYLILSELLNCLVKDKQLLNNYAINILVIENNGNNGNIWNETTSIISPTSRRSLQNLIIVKNKNEITISGYLSHKIIETLDTFIH